ncbi:ABC transporter permease protein [Williamsoniiplasma somnilux]|uniref:ABC transporter permease protein n=1 Tax=Williamsoniiplasma somnilux TaxID=215578 RepID=A0A2K8P0E2_9MOLU|nr:ABC transporter permease subunit [Williamsoniiplasma somnilux]ATZ18471.1 ABC transporter permease protein [Williamsoniiplasma somnilux]
MFNKEIIKSSVKESWILWVALTALSFGCLLSVIITGHASDRIPSMQQFIQVSFFSILATMFPMIFIAVIGNKLITGEVEKGHMAYLLSSPLSRTQIIISKMNFFILSVIAHVFVLYITGVIAFSIYETDITMLNWTLICLNFLGLLISLSAIAFFVSTYFNKSSLSLSITGGLTLLFIVFNFLGGTGAQLFTSFEWIKYLSLISLMDVPNINASDVLTWLPQSLALFGLSVCLYIGSIYVFKNKDLPL